MIYREKDILSSLASFLPSVWTGGMLLSPPEGETRRIMTKWGNMPQRVKELRKQFEGAAVLKRRANEMIRCAGVLLVEKGGSDSMHGCSRRRSVAQVPGRSKSWATGVHYCRV